MYKNAVEASTFIFQPVRMNPLSLRPGHPTECGSEKQTCPKGQVRCSMLPDEHLGHTQSREYDSGHAYD
jgi:hypothetical protein